MKYNDWKEVELGKVIEFNPTESLKKGTKAKKIAMDKLNIFDREIQGFEIAEFSGGTKFRNGDTLLARITPCLENGKTAQVRILDKDEIAFGSTEFIVMREKANETVNDFIYYLSVSDDFRNIAIKSMSGTSGRQRVQKDVLEKTIIKLPSVKVQMEIAHILSTLDDKIKINNNINENLQSLSQLLFKHWFIDFEFPDVEGLPYKSSGREMVNSELGMIPKGWEVKTIQDICTIRRGASPRPIQAFMDDTKEGIPWIKISDATAINTPFLLGAKEYIKQEGKCKSVFIEEGTLIVSNSATPGIPKFVEFKACVHDGWLILNKYDDNYRNFIYFLILSLRKNLINLSNGSVFNNLKTDIVKMYKFVNPDKDILNRYEEIISCLMDTILHNSIEMQNLKDLRNNLLPKLMNGEIDLDNLEINL